MVREDEPNPTMDMTDSGLWSFPMCGFSEASPLLVTDLSTFFLSLSLVSDGTKLDKLVLGPSCIGSLGNKMRRKEAHGPLQVHHLLADCILLKPEREREWSPE